MSLFGAATEAELHGLVDGRIEAGRRAAALRRVAGSPADRARVEAWQAQNDLLRSAFAGVDREPIPAMLDLRAKPQLHCIPANDAPLVAASREPSRRSGVLPALGAIVVVTTGLIGSWTLLSQAEPDPPPTIYELRGPIDADLTSRAEAALGTPGATARRGNLPTTKIPDLDGQGFRFVGAETDMAQPDSIQFRYRGDRGQRLVVSVRRDATPGATTPQRIGDAVRWRGGGKVYAMAGTVGSDRLLDLATTLRETTR